MGEAGLSKKEVTVWWEKDVNKMWIFHCFYCKTPLCQIYGPVTQVIPGDLNGEKSDDGERHKVLEAPIRIQCHGRFDKTRDDGPREKCPFTYILQGYVS